MKFSELQISEEIPKGQTFGDEEYSFSVEKAYEVAKSKPEYFVPNFPIEILSHQLFWWDKDPNQTEKHMKTVDTSYPILVTVDSEGYLSVSDGLNRLKKARDIEHRKTIDCYFIPWNEENQKKTLVRKS